MMATPKEDVEKLMNDLMPLAEKMLKENGEFFPYGGVITAEGKIVHHGAYTGIEQPKSADVIKLLIESFQKSAEEKKVIATAIIYDIKTIPPGQTEKTDAICVSLEHRDGYFVEVVFPYSLKNKELVVQPPFAAKISGKIFKTKKTEPGAAANSHPR